MGDHMDNYLILEFLTKLQAETCLTAINDMAAAYWLDLGYTVVNGQLIGKNAATGEDMPDSAKTITWDVVKTSPDGTFYFASLRNDDKFKAGADRLPPEIFGFVERPFPQEWVDGSI